MAKLVRARAWCNNEVAYLAWQADGKIDGCLGFMVTRIHLDTHERRNLPTWVAFTTQSNPDWEEQDTSVWPIQKFSWRDLTLRRKRDSLEVRPGRLRVRYEIVPVGEKGPGRPPVPPSPTAQPGKYKGTPIPLYVCGAAIQTNPITVTNDFGDVSVAFNNGILSTQFLRKQLGTKKGQTPSKKVVTDRINDTTDKLRDYLAGDILPFLRTLFERAEKENGQVHLALYELADPELIALLLKHQKRLRLILSTAGQDDKTKAWDVTNADARGKLHAVMGTRIQDRMFNNSSHIGHNKFAVLVVGGTPTAVWTGSTNWTATGLCAQTNNCIIADAPDVAAVYLAYWNRLLADKQPVPSPSISSPNKADQGLALRKSNAKPTHVTLDHGGTDTHIWFSPNTEKTGSPETRTVPKDLAVVFDLMKQAKDAIFFLVFNPGRSDPQGEDVNTVVSAAIDFGRHEPNLLVMGAISDPTAMPGYVTPPKGAKKDPAAPKIPLPAIFSPPGAPKVLMIRAAALNDLIGDFQKELLSAGHAIIHDKVVVIDPLSKTDCVVIAGSHNLGFKASYANDENFLIVRGNQDLALAYAVHVIDVYDHYKFRAAQAEQTRQAMLKKKTLKRPTDRGFLDTKPSWQDDYISGKKGQELRYFLK
jgi:phosphatidylserine/phosphatidylglycerophosphate/cardiolipin synthase-like enzyme